MPSKESDEAYAKRMLARADKVLESIDEAFIVTQRGHKLRDMPTFRPEEVSLGPLLGTGGFGIVNEIKKFTLDEDVTGQSKEADDDKADDSTDNNKENGTDNNAPPIEPTPSKDENHESMPSKEDNHDFHYDINRARRVMSSRVIRNGKGRYALKRLHDDLNTLEKARGMVDLAVEAKFLSIVWHPNIIKMRGMASGPMVDDYFFIILDRLVDTLDKRMNRWHAMHKKYNRGVMCGLMKNKRGLGELLLEAMTIAYDLAAAFFYLHENRLVYRDIKPENIGFDFRGDVKLFDFGLCKNLAPHLKAKEGGYGYRLTGRAGSLPYMAPEVAKMLTYDTKCDCFSFAILLWEMLSCTPAFPDYSSLQYMDKVVTEQERLKVSKSWPPLTRLMIPEAWDDDPRKRPDMKRIAILIRGDLNDMTTDERILHRTKHLAGRSQHSFNEELIDAEDPQFAEKKEN
mmetsp:Transcript_26/g.134  ORF Transcript_26/g.134 Transcript_26/m.134 type:complete len:457 (+) Transcript_26:330-1700(+)|eukprot:CAMPEP_0168749426 /NCGR_PEP_ID=MMETSP0724-20121128/16709_1 /TAXON_ID=265536 /ORGANISM="Amphiprora sp., Strain CCMP467" /LENGTH=456 /DNA_ID=CAMNT_0008797333 /DNA_START=277 /DNA_END=1647 /DNA_ORIENTATION=+